MYVFAAGVGITFKMIAEYLLSFANAAFKAGAN